MKLGYLLDTNILIDYLRGKEAAVKLVQELGEDARLGYAAITATEIYHGMREKEQEATDELLDGLVCIPFDQETAKLAGFIMKKYRKKGCTLELGDAMIAATTLLQDVVLVTLNKKHFTPITEVKLFTEIS